MRALGLRIGVQIEVERLRRTRRVRLLDHGDRATIVQVDGEGPGEVLQGRDDGVAGRPRLDRSLREARAAKPEAKGVEVKERLEEPEGWDGRLRGAVGLLAAPWSGRDRVLVEHCCDVRRIEGDLFPGARVGAAAAQEAVAVRSAAGMLAGAGIDATRQIPDEELDRGNGPAVRDLVGD